MLDSVDRESEAAFEERVDAERMREHVEAFAGLDRLAGTADEREAAEYVVETLASYGVEAELLEHEAYVSRPEEASLTATAPTAWTAEDAITVAFGASTPPGGVHGDLVHVEDLASLAGAGGVAPDLGGRVVFTRGLPTPDEVRRVAAAGADAVVFESVSPEHVHEMIVSPVWGTPALAEADELPDLPVVEVSQADGAWLRERLSAGPVAVAVEASVTTELATIPCPVGRVEGTASDRYMVVGNHVDSWYEGVTDNGTAMAATLELARLFADADLARGVLFGFWSGHSHGRYAGSAWYADEHWLDLRENAVAYLHLDLCGLRGAEAMWHQQMAELDDEHVDAIEAGTLPIAASESSFLGADRPGRNSDQSFWGVGAASMLSGARLDPDTEAGGPVGGGWWWHTPADTLDKVDDDVLAEETRLYARLVARVCGSPALPHDHRAAVSELRSVLADVAEERDRSFDAVRERLDALEDALVDAARVVSSVEDPTSELGRAVEDLQVDLGNDLVPARYTACRDVDQEPALPHDRLPGFRVDEPGTALERRFAERTLTREENRLAARLDRATRRVERFLDAHGE
jgi:hypothetical protein